MFADKAELFNSLVQRMCTLVDHRLDVPPRTSSRSQLRRVRSDVGQSHTVSSMRFRRCDSQHIAEEEDIPCCMDLLSTDDESRPVFVIADEELN